MRGHRRLAALALGGLGLMALHPDTASAAETQFYKGKTITLLVGYGVGGGYDLYARLLARHMAEHVAGQPTIIVENLPGAGGLRVANDVYAIAPKDGTVIAAVNPILLMYQLLGGKTAHYQTAKLAWVGSLDDSNNSIITWSASGIRTLDDAKTREVAMGGDGITSATTIYPLIANSLLGTKFKVINGYNGSNATDLAMESGEIVGRSGASLTSVFAKHADWVHDKTISFILQIGYAGDPALSGVPLLQDLVESERDKQIVKVVTLPTAVGPAYWLSPEVPKDRIAALREGFAATIADPGFLADAKKLGLEISPKTGEQLEAEVAEAATIPKDVMVKTAAILGW
jgi:tripartite-type tricarboxylate transporter receptor subunit TctC